MLMGLDEVKECCKKEIEIWRNKNNTELFPFCERCIECKRCPIYQLEGKRCVDILFLKRGRRSLREYNRPRVNASTTMRNAIIAYLQEFPSRWEKYLLEHGVQ